MSELDALIKQVEALAAGAPKPEALCWLHNGKTGEDWFADYCWDCAKKVKAWLCGGPKPETESYQDHPDWTDCTEEDIDIGGGYHGYEADGIEVCELCGCTLNVCLTDYGVGETIHNYDEDEGKGALSPIQWREWLIVLESMAGGYDENDQLYLDAIRVTRRLLNGSTDKANNHE